MSDVTLSAGIRSNLLSLQVTTDLLAQTQGRLATGKKVNSALDNPSSFFTAASLDARASDISNLLDNVGNGVQAIQAANTGLTSLQKLVDTAKSIAQQALQAPVAYTTKASISTATALSGSIGTADTLTNVGTTTADNALSGQTLSFTSGSGATLSLVLDDSGSAGTVNSIADLNTALSNNGINLTASFEETSGEITFTSTNDGASQTITTGSTAPTAGANITNIEAVGSGASLSAASSDPIADPDQLSKRANLVSQFNNIVSQINTTAQDSSFNGVNLLNGDQLKLTFNETGTSTLNIQGVTFDAQGLGLGNLDAATSFLDGATTNGVISKLSAAASTLRAQASAFGSNLSVVQARQDFSKNLINVLQTGSANLTLADTNLESANTLALQTRQQLGTTSLSLSVQADQSVLRLFG